MKRSEQFISLEIDATPAEAWDIIGAVTGVDQWLAPMITSCRVEGTQRICGTADGEFSEDILKIDHEHREFKYAIPEQHLLPVDNIVGLMKVTGDDRATIQWHWSFDVEPADEAFAQQMLAETGQVGIAGIERVIKSAVVTP